MLIRLQIITLNDSYEFKMKIDIRLFPFDKALKDNLQRQMFEQIGMDVIKNILKQKSLKNSC